MKKYIESDECRKPRKVDPDTHASRIETMCGLTNRLTGSVAEYDEDTTKKAILESFPEKWQREYLKSGKRYQNDEIKDIVEYMNLLKGMADDDDEKRGKKRSHEGGSAERIRGGGGGDKKRKDDKKGGNKSKRMSDSDECAIHGGHTWHLCSLNPRGPNYGKNMARGGRGGGRGRGGYNGRGNYGGRGNGGRFGGRGGYYSSNDGNGGRGNYQNQSNDQHYNDQGGQRNSYGQSENQNGWTQSDNFYSGPPGQHVGGGNNGGPPNNNYNQNNNNNNNIQRRW